MLVLVCVSTVAVLLLTGCLHRGETEGEYLVIQLASNHSATDVWYSLWEFIQSDNPIATNVGGVGWDMAQRVTVYLIEYNEEQVELFKTRILNSPFLYFELSPPRPQPLIPYD